MTISTTTIVSSHTGDGSTLGPFAYNYPITADTDLVVIIRTTATGAETVKTLTTHYTVSGAGTASGGAVTFTSGNAPASTEQVFIRRDLPLTQSVDYVENDTFQAEDHEGALDRLTMIVQEQQEELGRSFKVSRTNTITTSEFVDDASSRANKMLGFSSDGNTLQATTGRVSSVTVSAVGAGGSPTVSYNNETGALALGIVTGATGSTGSTGSAGADGVFSEIASQSEAQTGTNNTKGMTPLRVKEAVDSYGIISSTDIGSTVAAHNADTLFADVSDNLTAGFSSDVEAIGNSGTGTQTLALSSSAENLKTLTINGSFTLAPQTVNSVIALVTTNDGTGGYTITTSGYDKISGTYNNAAAAKHLMRSTVIDGTQVLEILEIA